MDSISLFFLSAMPGMEANDASSFQEKKEGEAQEEKAKEYASAAANWILINNALGDSEGSEDLEEKSEDVSELAKKNVPKGMDVSNFKDVNWHWDTEGKGKTDALNPGKTLPNGNPDKDAVLDVYIHPSVQKMNAKMQYMVFGHEWNHVYDQRMGYYGEWLLEHGKGIALDITEMRAYDWTSDQDKENQTGMNAGKYYGDTLERLVKAGIDYETYSRKRLK